MSVTTLPPTARGGDDFNDLAFAALVADFDQPREPLPDLEPDAKPARPVARRPVSRAVEKMRAIAVSQGHRRHRTYERWDV